MFGNVHYREWGIWLGKYHWDLFVTLHFDKSIDINKANHIVSKWLSELESDKAHYILIAESVANSKIKFRCHIFIANTQSQYARVLNNPWNKLVSIGKVIAYDPLKGASYYLKRYIKTSLKNITYSPHLREYLNVQAQKASSLNLINQIERDLLGESKTKKAALAVAEV